ARGREGGVMAVTTNLGHRGATNVADDDSALIRSVQSGDIDAFGELYRRHRAAVLRFLEHRLLRASPDIEDVAADAFVTALCKIDSFSLDRDGLFVNWLIGIARSKALQYHHYWRTHPEVPLRESDLRRLLNDRVIDAEKVVIDRLEVEALLAQITPPQRQAVVLQYAANLPVAEVARRQGTSKVAVWKLTQQARRSLREERWSSTPTDSGAARRAA
ncbi:MAG TPA: sigma-70 family RNA polymerase sigma factor, partial [Candidatus Dormibacteraeota bacterium]|nr:sigma-70 family RNA polymerase sigma factor [Candidatus Dormibacteraeota bacterium]